MERNCIGVHDPVDAHLPGMEIVALDERHGHRAVRLPSLLGDVVREVAGESFDGQRLVLGERGVIGAGQGDGVAVRHEQVPVDDLEGRLRLLAQLGLHLGRDHLAAEESGERIAHGALQCLLELADDSHVRLLSVALHRDGLRVALLCGVAARWARRVEPPVGSIRSIIEAKSDLSTRESPNRAPTAISSNCRDRLPPAD